MKPVPDLNLGFSDAEHFRIEELAKARTPLALISWVEAKIDETGSTPDGEDTLRLRKGLAKQLVEEVYPEVGWI